MTRSYNEEVALRLGAKSLATAENASEGDALVLTGGEIGFGAGNGGSLPFPLAAAEGIPGFDFADTYDIGTVFYCTTPSEMGLYLKTDRSYDVGAAVQAGGTDPATLPNGGITGWLRVGGDSAGWPVPGPEIGGNGADSLFAQVGKWSILSDLMAFAVSGNGLYWNYFGASVDGEQVLVAQVGPGGAHQVALASAAGSIGPAPGGIIFPTADPHIAGAWWDDAGTLTKSSG